MLSKYNASNQVKLDAEQSLKPGSHISPMVGDSLSVVIQEENS